MKAAEWFRKAERFVRSSAEGFDGTEFQRLFDRDAARAYDVVTREHHRSEEPQNAVWRFFYRARILLLGLSYKLSPPRRIVFVLCIAFALWAMIDRLVPLSLASVAGLVFLLVLELADRVVVRPLEAPVALTAPAPRPFQREGFTVLEWGVLQDFAM